jgi:lipoprotein-anchoring transpeptidase ErfK/SrfK
MATPPDETAGSRQARRKARTGGQPIKASVIALAIVLVAAGAGAVWRASQDDAEAAPPKSTATTTTKAAPAEFEPYLTATSTLPEIAAYEAPVERAPVVETFSELTEYLVPRTFLVIDQQPGWLQVLLPMRPNESTGWIRESEVTLGESDYDITVSLSTTTVTLRKAGEVILESPSGIGTEETPTPPGRYYITDPVDLRDQPDTGYGEFALGISGYSEVLFEFNGGPGQVAIHGTANPSDLGQKVSNGCVRVPNEIILQIAEQVPVGTPFTVVA